jgi:hypothetical protein
MLPDRIGRRWLARPSQVQSLPENLPFAGKDLALDCPTLMPMAVPALAIGDSLS